MQAREALRLLDPHRTIIGYGGQKSFCFLNFLLANVLMHCNGTQSCSNSYEHSHEFGSHTRHIGCEGTNKKIDGRITSFLILSIDIDK